MTRKTRARTPTTSPVRRIAALRLGGEPGGGSLAMAASDVSGASASEGAESDSGVPGWSAGVSRPSGSGICCSFDDTLIWCWQGRRIGY
jgi:hypothetical protein